MPVKGMMAESMVMEVMPVVRWRVGADAECIEMMPVVRGALLSMLSR